MEGSCSGPTRRGQYKAYVRNSNASIPKTSLWRMRRKRTQQTSSTPSTSTDNTSTTSNPPENNLNDEFLATSSPPSCPPNVSDSGSENDMDCGMLNESLDATNIDMDDEHSFENDDDDDDDEGVMNETGVEEEDVELSDNMFDPIYENASITVSGAYCAIMEFKRACRLSFATIAMLLELLQLLCPKDNNLPKTVYLFRKFFQRFSSSSSKRQFCSIRNSEYKADQEHCENSSCYQKEPNTLITLNPKKALSRIIKKNFNKLILTPTSQGDLLCDVHTGVRYRKIVPSGHGGIIFNTDGISPFKSSCITVWPVLVALSILPPSIRMNKNNLVTVALWAGESKPPMKALFVSLVELLDELSRDGIQIKAPTGEKTIKFLPLFGLFDMIAKAPVLNMKQFNGKNGCPTCLHPGVWTSSRYYLPESYSARSNDSIKEAGRKVEEEGCVVEGIKGRSILTDVVDLVKDIPIDYMHCVLEGVTKWLVEKWFSSSKAPYYINGKEKKLIDSHLLLQRPPHDFSRAPRGIQYRSHWKASEFRNWLLYYSVPLLVSVLPPLYLHHYTLLVCALHVLLQSKISKIQVQAAEKMLTDFYEMLPELYGNNSCTINAHSLSHLTEYVKLWGPLWTQSLFGFESFNGHIISMIHSKRKVGEQLSFSLDVSLTVGVLADKLFEVENEQTLKFLAPMSEFTMKRDNMILVQPGMYSVGPLQSYSLSATEASAVFRQTGSTLTKITSFKKVYFRDTLFHSTQSDGKRDSSICCYALDGTKNYGCIQKFCYSPLLVLIMPFKKTSSSLLKSIGNPCRRKLSEYIEVDLLAEFFVQVDNELLPPRAIPISAILSKCIRVSCDNSYSYIVPIPNNYEHH